MTTVAPPAPGTGRPFAGRAATRGLLAVGAPRTWGSQIHLVVDALSALATSIPLTVLTAITVFSLPFVPVSVVFFALLLVASRLAGRFLRGVLAAVPGLVLADPHRPSTGGIWSRALARVRSAATWKELTFHLLHVHVAVVFVVVSILSWAIALSMVTVPLWIGQVPAERVRLGPMTARPGLGAVAVAVVGLALLLAAPWITRGLSRLSCGLASGLLGRAEADDLRARVDTLEVTRARATDAAEIERQRIERNLHDGAQQRLVALAMALGLAQEKFDADPAGARALVDEAHAEAKRALVELRDLARGLHPPVLTDRGLEAAVAGLASRSPVPVTLDIELARRPTPAVEGVAYFLIAECLANVARHSAARRAAVRIVDGGDRLLVEVTDDGVGGANATAGTGLSGLADRVAAVDGQYSVMSPPGGPTTVRAELPLPHGAARTDRQEEMPRAHRDR